MLATVILNSIRLVNLRPAWFWFSGVLNTSQSKEDKVMDRHRLGRWQVWYHGICAKKGDLGKWDRQIEPCQSRKRVWVRNEHPSCISIISHCVILTRCNGTNAENTHGKKVFSSQFSIGHNHGSYLEALDTITAEAERAEIRWSSHPGCKWSL